MSRRAERSMVPDAEFRSYYGQPVIKSPTWKTPDVPVYFFLGGLAGSSSAMAAMAELTGRERAARVGYLTAAAGAAGGTVALIHDLGRPERFLNMLRVIKPTSPLNTGSWVLAGYASLSGAAALSSVTGVLPGLARLAKAGAAALSPVMMTYTAILVADTAVPNWHEAYRELPFVFAGSALISGGGVGVLAAPTGGEADAARALAVTGAAMELAAESRMTARLGMLAEPYETGRPGRWMRAGRALAAAGALGVVAGRRSRAVSVLSGAALLAGALCTRFGVFEAGMAAAKDPKYTVVPQRERLDGRAAQPVTASFVPAAGQAG